MEERRLENVGESAQRAGRWIADEAQGRAARAQERAQEAASRAGAYVQKGVRGMDDQVARMTGRTAESWLRDIRGYVEEHPLQAVAMTVGIGFVLGKILARR
jgi:ElaB/YqjD/DUF883 family membrane-anchored ribosome-binding protein